MKFSISWNCYVLLAVVVFGSGVKANAIGKETKFEESETNLIETGETKELEGKTAESYPDRQGRTLNHIAHKVHFIEAGLESVLRKFFSLFLKTDLSPSDYADYRKEGGVPAIQTPDILRPLANIPQFLTSHPINFKKHLSNFHHSIGKRSISDQDTTETEFQTPNENFRSGKTLHKLIPNFEQNFNKMFRRIFPSFSSQTQFNTAFTGDEEQVKSPPSSIYDRQNLGFTTLMRMLPQLLNRRTSADPNYSQPQNLLSATLQRFMERLRSPIIQNSQRYYPSQ